MINGGRIILYKKKLKKRSKKVIFHARKDLKFGKLSKNVIFFTNM